MPYNIEYLPEAKQNLRDLPANDRSLVLAAIVERLAYQAEEVTTNRKRMRENRLGIQWELRVGDLRVFYNVHSNTVFVLYIGRKKNNEVFVGREKLEL